MNRATTMLVLIVLFGPGAIAPGSVATFPRNPSKWDVIPARAGSAILELDGRQGRSVDLKAKYIRTGVMTRHIERTAGSRSR